MAGQGSCGYCGAEPDGEVHGIQVCGEHADLPALELAANYLDARARSFCDATAGKGKQQWNSSDMHSVKLLVRELQRRQELAA